MSDTEHLDVLIVGAGLSGIGAAHHIKHDTPWATFAVFEARDAIGGTWDLFRYPGIRSDSDMHTLGYPFRPWDGEKSIAPGDQIRNYIKATADEDGTTAKIRFNHRIVRADWVSDDARWHITAERADTGETVEVTAGFLFTCSGYYRYDHGYLPDFPGMERFAGTTIHPQQWPEDLDYAGKRVIVIGSGATAITLIPSMAKDAGHVTMLQRSPSYIAVTPDGSPITPLLRRVLPGHLGGQAIRYLMAVTTQGWYRLSKARPQLMKSLLLKGVARQLPEGYDIETHFTPSYNPWDQRVCIVPNGDLFKAIRNGKASVVTDTIDSFTEKGILLDSGTELEADIIITATGLEVLFIGGIELTVDGEKVDPSTRLMYKGMMMEGVPNFANALGYTNASWTLRADLISEYVARLLNHLRRTGMRQATPVNTDSSLGTESLLPLSSGYLQRAADRLPRQGSRLPWHVTQSWLADRKAMRGSPLEDDAMVFSNPTTKKVEAAA